MFWTFFGFGFIWLRFVSVRGAAFDIRISDLFRWLLGAITIFCHDRERHEMLEINSQT